MKNSIFLLISFMILTVSCKQEQPTNLSLNYDKYLVQNDSDWVEVTDIDTVKVCISDKLYKNGIALTTEADYKSLFFETLKDDDYLWHIRNYPNKTSCTEEYQTPQIDFEKQTLVLYRAPHGGGNPQFIRKIYRNSITNELLYLLETIINTQTMENSYFVESITIPRLNNGNQIKFDTINTYNVK